MLLSEAAPPDAKDPAAFRRLALTFTALVILGPLFRAAEVSPAALLVPENLKVIGQFLAAFLPPETNSEFLGYLARATLETLAIATAGMALALLFAIPCAFLATAAGRDKATSSPIIRAILVVLRGIPELVWALLFVRVFGLGPAAGVLALGLTYGGMLAKVYAETLESVNPLPARALKQSGASRFLALIYGTFPLAARELVSYTVYRWECAIRASVVMGFVGAGGLGQLMDQAMKMLNGGEAATILLTFMALVLLADLFSRVLREGMERPVLARAWVFGPGPVTFGLGLLMAVLLSFAFLNIGFSALFTQEAAAGLGDFVAGFFPPNLSAGWLQQVAKGSFETLAISAVGTLLAAVGGLILALARPRPAIAVLLNGLRSVPELVWATITVLAVGLGPFAGALALSLHTAGVLGRLYAEALENAPTAPARALKLSGAPAGLAFFYGTLPVVASQWLAYTLYRWEINIRMAAVLGFVGAGGLGQLLYVKLSLFQYGEASTVIIAMLLLSFAVDRASSRLRRKL